MSERDKSTPPFSQHPTDIISKDTVSYKQPINIEQQAEYVRYMLEGRREGREQCWSEFTRLDGEVRMFEALLESLENTRNDQTPHSEKG